MENLPVPLGVRDLIRARIEKWIEAFEKGYRQNMGILGRSGLGKTQLLSEIYQVLAARPESFISIYIDARTLDFDHFLDRWLGALLSGAFLSQNRIPPADFQSLIAEAGTFIPKTVEKIRHLKKMVRREKPSAVLRELFSLPGALHHETGRKVLLMIDEFDALSALPASDPFAALGREIMIEKNVLYLAASSNPIKAREIFRERLTLLFGNFEIIEFANLEFEEAARFFESRLVAGSLSPSQKRFMIRMTDGHPLYLELLADRLESLRGNRNYIGEVPEELFFDMFFRELLDAKGRISLLLENRLQACSSVAKDASACVRSLLAISLGRRRVLGISAFIGRKVQETKKILQKLVQEDLIAKSGAFYLVTDPLFRFWLTEVYQKRNQAYLPDSQSLGAQLMQALKREFESAEREEKTDITSRVESLFKEFRNDVLELGQKKIKCPQFSEIAFRPTNGRVFPVFAKSPKARWICQIAKQAVREEDVASFLEELKRKNVQRKVMITLGGIDQNAKLMAQQANIQLWGLRNFNALLELYNLPKMILFSEREEDGTALGALAQSLHTA